MVEVNLGFRFQRLGTPEMRENPKLTKSREILLNSGSSTRLYGMRLTAALYNGAVRGQPVDSHVIICHTSVTCETSFLCLYIYHIRRVNMI